MKLSTWNVNSIQARKERILAFLERESPDVLCLQETKISDEKFPVQDFQDKGYYSHFYGQKSYNGVAFLSKQPMSGIEICPAPFDAALGARVLVGQWGPVKIVNLYAVNGKELGSPQFASKEAWFQQLQAYLQQQDLKNTPVLVCGDLNVAPTDLDAPNPLERVKELLLSPEERAWFASIIELGFVDCFRSLYPEERTFSWWDYRQLSFQRNKGLRIDFILVNERLHKRCVACRMDRDERKGEKPSDHIPVTAEFVF